MKRRALAVSLLTLALAGAVRADLCTSQATPAATLLLPYFEVDIDDPNGIDTFLSVNNAGPYGLLGHVVVWTDMSVEALDFNIFLTGYDVQTIGLGLIIRNGILPVTGFDDSPLGPFSDDWLAGSGASCASASKRCAMNAFRATRSSPSSSSRPRRSKKTSSTRSSPKPMAPKPTRRCLSRSTAASSVTRSSCCDAWRTKRAASAWIPSRRRCSRRWRLASRRWQRPAQRARR